VTKLLIQNSNNILSNAQNSNLNSFDKIGVVPTVSSSLNEEINNFQIFFFPTKENNIDFDDEIDFMDNLEDFYVYMFLL
jgi:hypothetical protein